MLERWLEQWAWGRKTATDICRDARAALEEDKKLKAHNVYERLAKAAYNTGNAHRVLESIAPENELVPATDIDEGLVKLSISPFDMFHWLLQKKPRKFKIHMGGGLRQGQALFGAALLFTQGCIIPGHASVAAQS